jgi:hypothetical protein
MLGGFGLLDIMDLKLSSQGRRILFRFRSTFDVHLGTKERLLNDDFADCGDADKAEPHFHIGPLKVMSLSRRRRCTRQVVKSTRVDDCGLSGFQKTSKASAVEREQISARWA